jgi:hypothetical protein
MRRDHISFSFFSAALYFAYAPSRVLLRFGGAACTKSFRGGSVPACVRIDRTREADRRCESSRRDSRIREDL